MNFELASNYYTKIKEYSKKNVCENYIVQHEFDIYASLKEIIDMNLDYLLTDSLIDYMCRDHMLQIDLYCIKNHYECYDLLFSYFKKIIKEYDKIDDDNHLYIRLLDTDTKNATIKAYNYINNLYKNYNNYHYRLNDVEQVIYIVLSYCLINKKMNEFEDICNPFISNPYDTLDDLYMNDIRNAIGMSVHNNFEGLVDRVINIIERKKTIN